MLEIRGSREEMYAAIEGGSQQREARIFTKPSKSVFFHLLQKTQVDTIYMTRGIYSTVPQKVLEALESSGVSVHILEKGVGRPKKFSHEKKLEALKMLKEGKTASKISGLLHIPTTSIYAWKRRMKKKDVCMPDST